MSILENILGNENDRQVRKWRPIVDKINALEPTMKELSDGDFVAKTQQLKDKLSQGKTLDDILPEAFAAVREASVRTFSLRPYDVQMIGGIALHNGGIAEMRTGEGKTLMATLPAYLNSLTEQGVHIVTVNDYLSRRDAVWMGPLFATLGISCAVVNSENKSYIYDPTHQDKESEVGGEISSFKVQYEFLRPCSRRDAYACDITYGTNNEFGFDFLRDNLANSIGDVVQRGHHFAIVDEVDSILIDESRTPLIISSAAEDSEDLYYTFADIAKNLKKDEDYGVDEKLKAISLTDQGITKAEDLLGIKDIYTQKGIKYVHHLETAVKARALYENNKDYVVKDGEVIIVDAFTGRMQPGRRWSEGLHQAIEAKEGVKIEKETRAVASITFQNYFRFYKKLSGMTGTAETSKEEFFKVYGLNVIVVPTHKNINRIDLNDLIYQTEKSKLLAVSGKVKELHLKGQPVLIGTVSIEKNELLSAYLTQAGVPHTVLNAKNHEREGEIIANAGRLGAVTVATNMAGRGVDIKLGGVPFKYEAYEEVKALGGLFVLGTERHEARRIDNQLRGRSGRQGDPGETQFYVSLEDDLMRIFGSDRLKNMMGKLGIPEDQPVENRFISNAIESAQAKIEGFHFDSRKHTLEYDNVMNHQRNVIYSRRRAMLAGDYEKIQEFLDELVILYPKLIDIIKEKRLAVGDATFFETVRRIILYITDNLWIEHLETMEYTRSSVNLRAYGQREPLIEYKKEGLRLFKEMEVIFKEQVSSLISTMNVGVERSDEQVVEEKQSLILSSSESGEGTTKRESPKIGRNDLCPCGSGKKYKVCHGKDK
ncbi:TPA: preprotein translocase subunit SecA [Candidatus Nomurabacteria bacterium]|uniref:Protein translocase subunit SecA n=1 Tax=Candidatus Nomurabacteria bacterium GW2011_GWE1_35_16 TaxID=1618761 RepID=A0A0G0DV75_9BACT|nr:MAG: Protein translocase subunit SecA [Candidatus Nomurabacteria bacterium GW2011_GWF1_34_20]KKP63713.1 MAG: Protein translocase subunit SecA [Candidatus Nomurabacteria bacterium GW2011_GWE2_34_25]KKP66925.1 MAG: Protein translocase subunit SecA [Candidatus Nomurabacteria bacterium GW2011_GWE1_35_16]HAE36750.1 preprotein translocase subunit SecA [Candidatus Nomurabacteria bacterium]HAX65547.1 preprotein translocase subunit SecA [Candidatus Nomurabacteria bacterium]